MDVDLSFLKNSQYTMFGVAQRYGNSKSSYHYFLGTKPSDDSVSDSYRSLHVWRITNDQIEVGHYSRDVWSYIDYEVSNQYHVWLISSRLHYSNGRHLRYNGEMKNHSKDSLPLYEASNGKVGRWYDHPSMYFRGNIGEILIFDQPLTDEQTDQIHCYLSEKRSLGLDSCVDKTPTIHSQPQDSVVDATVPWGAYVIFALPTVTDYNNQPLVPLCTRNSGEFFPVGTTTVICTARDSEYNETATSFDVTVNDVTWPRNPSSSIIVIESPYPWDMKITLQWVTMYDAVEGEIDASCAYDETMGVGSQQVTCTASDSRNNMGTGTITLVRVQWWSVDYVPSGSGFTSNFTYVPEQTSYGASVIAEISAQLDGKTTAQQYEVIYDYALIFQSMGASAIHSDNRHALYEAVSYLRQQLEPLLSSLGNEAMLTKVLLDNYLIELEKRPYERSAVE